MGEFSGTIFGIRIRDANNNNDNSYAAPPSPPKYNPYKNNFMLPSLTGIKEQALRAGSNALRFKVWMSLILFLFNDRKVL